MERRVLYLLLALFIFLTAAVLLISGSSVLLISLSKSPYIPLGTLITWLGVMALPLVLYFGVSRLRNPKTKTEKYLALLLKVFIGLATFWAPVCYLLAGNFSFTFTEKTEFQGGQLAMKLFWHFSYLMIYGPILLILSYGLSHLFRRKK